MSVPFGESGFDDYAIVWRNYFDRKPLGKAIVKESGVIRFRTPVSRLCCDRYESVSTPNVGTDLAAMRRLNGNAVLGRLWDADHPQTATQLAAATQLSRTTVEAVLAELTESELVAVAAPKSKGSGRPARGYRFATERGALIGLDAGPNCISGIVTDLRGNPLAESAVVDGDFAAAPSGIEAILSLIDRLLEAANIGRQDLDTLGIAFPGIVDAEGAPALTSVVPDWVSTNIADQLRAAFPRVRVEFANDTKLAAAAELHVGSIAADETAILLRTGQRISAATVMNGHVSRGAHGAAGEIGALARIGWPAAHDRFSSKADAFGGRAALYAAGQSGNADALAAVAGFAEDIADGLGALVLAVDPHAIVLSGEDPVAHDLLAAALSRALIGRTLYVPEVRASKIDRDAAARGAIVNAATSVRARLLGA